MIGLFKSACFTDFQSGRDIQIVDRLLKTPRHVDLALCRGKRFILHQGFLREQVHRPGVHYCEGSPQIAEAKPLAAFACLGHTMALHEIRRVCNQDAHGECREL